MPVQVFIVMIKLLLLGRECYWLKTVLIAVKPKEKKLNLLNFIECKSDAVFDLSLIHI